MLGGDNLLTEAVASGGLNMDRATARAWRGADGHELNDTQIQQMQRMRDAGLHHKSTTFLAAASAMSTAGRGSTISMANALGNAARAGASATDTDSAFQSALSAYRTSGRGDIAGEMEAQFNANTRGGTVPLGHATPLGAGELIIPAGPVLDAARVAGWNRVSASSVRHNAINPANPDGVVGAASYQSFLGINRENTSQALTGYNQMEPTARDYLQPIIIAAAQARQATETGLAATITNIQTAKAYFDIR